MNPLRLTKCFFDIRFGLSILSAIVLFSACKVTQPTNSAYFKNLQRDSSFRNAAAAAESKIRKKDQLAIVIASSSREEDIIYNAPAAGAATASLTGGNTAASGYWVDANGNIQLHKLGVIHAEGMTRRELRDKVQKDLQPYLKDPVVSVQYLNHKVTIIGEVKAPKVIPMPEEQLSILDVLASGGDVTELARRDNVLVIRDAPDGKQTQRINLEDKSIFSSPWYYLQPDDVVYISPDPEIFKQKAEEAKRARNLQTLSLAVSAASVAIIILDRILK